MSYQRPDFNEVNDWALRIFWTFLVKDFLEFWVNVMLPYRPISNVRDPGKNRYYSPEEHVII